MSSPDLSESSAAKRPIEMTLTAVGLGIALSVVMGAANVYLGLKVGMTVSASIPAAVVAMGILRGVLRRRSVLEANLVQTAASAGESLAAGIIFTMPALVILGIWKDFDFWTTTFIALAGGLLGVLLMIPMRRVFIVENEELKFPEGVACAEVLRAGEGEEESTGVLHVLGGIAVGGVLKFVATFLGLLKETAEWATIAAGRVFFLGADISPALVSVGFIVGFSISAQIFLGGGIGWLVTIPLMGLEGFQAVAGGWAKEGGEAMSTVDVAYHLWSTKVRYMGVGAMVVGGLASIWKVRHGLLAATREIGSLIAGGVKHSEKRTEQNLSGKSIVAWSLISIGLISGLYYYLLGSISLTVLTTIAMCVMSFFMSAVASYIVGLVGNSNSPVSGMTIMAVLGTGGLIYLFGYEGNAAIIATLGVAGIVCCVACTSGDVCNDLKTGHMVGASPRSQQIMQVIGVVVAAFIMAPVLTSLHTAYGIGDKLAAPQAGLFASLAKGFFGTEPLPHIMVAIGAAIGVALLIGDFFLERAEARFRLYVMPVAVGIYLPFGVAIPMLLGGFLSWLVSRRPPKEADAAQKTGVLIASGIIAGESLLGVFLGFVAYGQDRYPAWLGDSFPQLGGALMKSMGIGEGSADGILSVASLVVLGGVAAYLLLGSINAGRQQQD